MTSEVKRPVVLCILDGWGHREAADDNAISCAHTPHYDRLLADFPNSVISTSGSEVGLPDGQMGNSEVGHMNIGGGRIVMQNLPLINAAIASGELAGNAVLQELIKKLQQTGGTCHLMGLISPGGVHSHQDHVVALARILDEADIPVAVHAFLDGRDTPPSSARNYLAQIETALASLAGVHIVTIMGRYYAMDRDQRWDRTQAAYEALTAGAGSPHSSVSAAIEAAYAAGETDEFVTPRVIDGYKGMTRGDGLLMANFRSDRARQILSALIDPEFHGFDRTREIGLAAKCGMVTYSDVLAPLMATLYPTEFLEGTLGEVIAAKGLTQLRIAETEKYAHVTFFLNGGREARFKGEDRILIPSPKVATYDLKPEMSAVEVTDALVTAIKGGEYDLCVVNFANPDMVGHTGIMAAAVKAVETIDECLGRLSEAVKAGGGALLITADHGNVEMLVDDDSNGPHTAHTTLLVPLLAINTGATSVRSGRLADIAPTVLELMAIEKPAEMTGTSLIEGYD